MASRKYYLVAGFISILWWPLLQIAPIMRTFLGVNSDLEIGVLAQIVMFATAGLITAALFRRVILKRRGAWSAVIGVLLAFVTAEIFCIILVAYHTVLGNRDVLSAVWFGPIFAAQAFYIVVPLGIGTQWVLRRVESVEIRHAG